MSNTYLGYWNELLGWVPGLPAPIAQTLVNRAWRDIQDARPWTFLLGEGILQAPGLASAGTVELTQFDDEVVGDATAAASWLTLANPVITQRQFRVGSGGAIYSITAFDGVDTLTLDRPYQEDSAPDSEYSIYRCYYPAQDGSGLAIDDFLRWVSVYDPYFGYSLQLHKTRQWVDLRDPVRGALGQPYYIANFKTDPDNNNQPVFELWPHPTTQRSYITIYQKRATLFEEDDDALPPQIPSELLLAKARINAYEWAEANKMSSPALQKTNWLALLSRLTQIASGVSDSYPSLLRDAKRTDEETYQQNFILQRRNGPYDGVSANFAQSHDMSWFY